MDEWLLNLFIARYSRRERGGETLAHRCLSLEDKEEKCINISPLLTKNFNSDTVVSTKSYIVLVRLR